MDIYIFKREIDRFNFYQVAVLAQNLEQAKKLIEIDLELHEWGRLEDGKIEKIQGETPGVILTSTSSD